MKYPQKVKNQRREGEVHLTPHRNGKEFAFTSLPHISVCCTSQSEAGTLSMLITYLHIGESGMKIAFWIREKKKNQWHLLFALEH